jgi:uncharacterized Fe-S cluster-containing MiaB family protein
MLKYDYPTVRPHSHNCDACDKVIKEFCVKNCNSYIDELCSDCKDEYKRYIEKMGRMK